MKQRNQRIVNSLWRIDPLLLQLGIDLSNTGSTTFHCPFPDHPGDDSKKSAQAFYDTNSIYCYTEHRTYRPYDLLKILGYSDNQIMRSVIPHLGSIILEDVDFSLPVFSKQIKLSRKKFIQSGDVTVLHDSVLSYLREVRDISVSS
jgi:hypothetical protein